MSVPISKHRDAPSEPQSGHAVEIGLAGTSGDGSQSLGTGQQPILLGGQTFLAPQQLRYEFDFNYLEAAYRYRKFFGRSAAFGIEALGGLGYASLDLTAASASQRARERISSAGLTLGTGGIWRFRPTSSLQARVAIFGAFDSDGITGSRLDFFVAQALGKNAALRAGYSRWSVNSDEQSSRSEIEIKFSGPALGLDVMF